jgi:hypothetical protein
VTPVEWAQEAGYDVVARPDPGVKARVSRFLNDDDYHRELRLALGLGAVGAAFVRGLGEHMARYANGTAPAAFFLLDVRAIKSQAKRCNVPLSLAVETTLLHEYAHAHFDGRGADLDPDDEEVLAERFAQEAYAGYAEAAIRLALNA